MLNWSKNPDLLSYVTKLLGNDLSIFAESEAENPAIRVNTLKTTPAVFEKFLDRIGQEYKRLAFNTCGYQLPQDNLPLSHTLHFYMGHFQYQGIASQLPVILLDVKPGNKVLDMAAAPGSKASQLAALLQNRGELVLNDATRNRHQALNVNMQRSGAMNYYVLNAWGERMGSLFPEYFDKILLDSPCSALGTLPVTPGILDWWSMDRMLKLSRVQHQLLVSAIKALKPGGELVYSTCSIAPEENELLIQHLLTEYPLEIVSPPVELSTSFDPGWIVYNGTKLSSDLALAIRTWPHRHRMEGFFMIKLKKLASVSNRQEEKTWFVPTLPAEHPAVTEILSDLEKNWGIKQSVWSGYRFITTRTRLWIVHAGIEKLCRSRFVSAGLLLAEKRLFGWKLSNGGAQVFSGHITKRRIEIDPLALKILFEKGRIFFKSLADGYHALEYEGNILACVYAEKGEMRISLPHYFNLIL
jgi:16S rRNA (cytosine1407-C5)-methyltransferase